MRFVKALAEAVKRGACDTLEAMVRLALTSIRNMTNWFLAKVIEMRAFLKPLERRRSAIKQAEAIIKAVVAEIGETEKNLVKYVRASAA